MLGVQNFLTEPARFGCLEAAVGAAAHEEPWRTPAEHMALLLRILLAPVRKFVAEKDVEEPFGLRDLARTATVLAGLSNLWRSVCNSKKLYLLKLYLLIVVRIYVR